MLIGPGGDPNLLIGPADTLADSIRLVAIRPVSGKPDRIQMVAITCVGSARKRKGEVFETRVGRSNNNITRQRKKVEKEDSK